MNIKFLDENTFDIYLKKECIDNINFNDKKSLENYLKKLFKLLNDKYYIKVEGFYEITVYIDKYYGVVLHLEKDDIDYYNFYKNQVDMRIYTINSQFLYLVEDIPSNYKKFDINIIDSNIYLKINKKLSKIEMMYLLENSEVVYNI